MLYVTVGVAIIFGISRLLLGNWDKSALFTSLFTFLFFSYGYISPHIGGKTYDFGFMTIGPNKSIILVYFLLLLAAFIFLFVTTKNLHLVNRYLNITSLFLIGWLLFPILTHVTTKYKRAENLSTVLSGAVKITQNQSTLPDVYYIIPEDYASSSTLKDYYQFDNSNFINTLISQGFVVNSAGQANYGGSALSIASSLNMDYLDVLDKNLKGDKKEISTYFPLLQNSKVVQLIQSLGYMYYHLGSWYGPTKIDSAADENFLYEDSLIQLPRFDIRLIDSTMILPFINNDLPISNVKTHQGVSLYQFAELPYITTLPGPKFVLAHIIMSHDPYIFDAHCNFKGEQPGLKVISQYLDQLQCTNSQLEWVIDSLRKTSKVPPIIIIQSDEGTHSLKYGNQSSAPEYNLEKTRILEAMYLPGIKKEEIPTDLTPVNIFRFVFDHYFSGHFPLLPNKVYPAYLGNTEVEAP